MRRKLAVHRYGNGADPHRSPGNTPGDGRSHDAWGHPTHRHFHGGGDNTGEAQKVDINSFLAGGRAADLDKDLTQPKLSFDRLKITMNKKI